MEKLHTAFALLGSGAFIGSLVEGLGGDYETALKALIVSSLSFAGAQATAQK